MRQQLSIHFILGNERRFELFHLVMPYDSDPFSCSFCQGDALSRRNTELVDRSGVAVLEKENERKHTNSQREQENRDASLPR